MHLVNQMYSRRQFWDLRAETLEAQVLMPIQDSIEMGMTLNGAMGRVQERPYYRALFNAAFGDDSITPDRVSRALAQFVRSIVSYRTRYDVGMQSGFADFNADYADNGSGEITGNGEDNGKFKVPSLRNVAISGPFMHDGRFNTLEEVVEHYNSGIRAHPDLDDRLTVEGVIGGTPLQMQLSAYDKQALVAFLGTLTDEPLVHDPRFSDPFTH